MKKVFVICQEEPFYIPKQVGYILDHAGDDGFTVIGATVLSPERKNASKKEWFRERAKVYTTWELILATSAFVLAKSLGKLGKWLGKDPYSVKQRFLQYHIPHYSTQDVNDPEYVRTLQELAPDVILSISPPQIFKKDLLQAAKEHCLNVHGTLLPRHRGVFGSWWSLYDGDEIAGGTIHTMEEKLDAGEILWQKGFPIKERETQFSLAYKTKSLMATGVIETLEELAKGAVEAIHPVYKPSYHRAPTKQEGKQFHEKGGRVITLSDIPPLFKSYFEWKRVPADVIDHKTRT